MKTNNTTALFFVGLLIFSACASNNNKIIFYPETDQQTEQQEIFDFQQIIESQNGPANALPEWVSSFFEGGIQKVESLSLFQNSYVFIGNNHGTNLSILTQWADRFTTAHDMPRLAALRVERKMLTAASLYPDDEYGEYFEVLIKSVSNEKYPEAVKEDSFWVKRLVRIEESIFEETDIEAPQPEIFEERYDIFVLVSINKIVFQTKIRELMAGIKTVVPPTRNQTASINSVQQTFFEGF